MTTTTCMTQGHAESFERTSSANGEKRTWDLGVFVLPAALSEEAVVDDDTRVNSEGYTSRIYQCCY